MKKLSQKNIKGTALIIALILVVIIVALVTTIIFSSSAASVVTQEYLELLNAEYAVKAGISAAVIALNQDAGVVEIQGNAGSWDSVIVQLEDGSWSQLSNNLGDISSANAEKTFQNRSKKLQQRIPLDFKVVITFNEVVYEARSYSFYQGSSYGLLGYIGEEKKVLAAFGDKEIKVRDNAKVDSYDSAKGNYGSDNKGTQGNIGSNGKVIIQGRAQIFGDATPGKNSTVNQPENVSGDITPRTENLTLVSIDDSWLGTEKTDFPKVIKNGEIVLTDGEYHYDDVDIESGSLVISGEVTIYCHDDFICEKKGRLQLDSGAKLTVYVGDTFEFMGTVEMDEQKPSHFQVKSIFNDMDPDDDSDNWDDNTNILISGNSSFIGIIYAPQTTVKISIKEFFGAVTAYRTVLSGQVKFHADEALEEKNETVYVTLGLNKVPFVDK